MCSELITQPSNCPELSLQSPGPSAVWARTGEVCGWFMGCREAVEVREQEVGWRSGWGRAWLLAGHLLSHSRASQQPALLSSCNSWGISCPAFGFLSYLGKVQLFLSQVQDPLYPTSVPQQGCFGAWVRVRGGVPGWGPFSAGREPQCPSERSRNPLPWFLLAVILVPRQPFDL